MLGGADLLAQGSKVFSASFLSALPHERRGHWFAGAHLVSLGPVGATLDGPWGTLG